MSEDDLFSVLAVTVTKLQCKISHLENKCKNQTTYVHELNSELSKEREETKRINEIIEDLLAQENLLKGNINSIRQSNAAAEESLTDLKNEVALEVTKTRQLKIEQDEALAKYTARWESYQEIYNSFPLAQERNKLSFVLKANKIETNVVTQKIFETRKKLNTLECIKEKREQVLVVRMAEAYKKYNDDVKKREQILLKIRKVKEEIELVKAEKAALVGNIRNKIDVPQDQAGSHSWSYPGIIKSWSCMEMGQHSNFTTAFNLQKLKLPEFNITSPPSLNFSDWNTRPISEKTSIGLKIDNSPKKSLNQLNKHQNSKKTKNYMESSRTPFNVSDINEKTTILEKLKSKTESYSSSTDRLFSADEKQKNMQEYFPGDKTKHDQENHKLVQNMQSLDRKTMPETEGNVNEIPQENINDKISTNKPTLKTSLKQQDLQPAQKENPSVVIQINTGLVNASTSEIDLNTPLRSLIDRTNLKRQNENNNYDFVTKATVNAMKSKYNPQNILQTINANSVQNPKTNLQKNQNKGNITLSSFGNNNKISDLKSQLGIKNSKLQKFNLGITQPEIEKDQPENDLQMKYPVSNQQSKVPEEVTVMVHHSAPDLVPTQPTQVLSQGSNNISSSEFSTPTELDEAGRIAYRKIVEESPGYENHPGPRMYNDELSQSSESGEQSHYFMKSQLAQEGSQDEGSVVYSPPFSYIPQLDSYIHSPPPAEIITPSDSNYVLSPLAGGSFGDGNCTTSKPNPNVMLPFGPKLGDKPAKVDSDKTGGFNFSFGNNKQRQRSSIFNLF